MVFRFKAIICFVQVRARDESAQISGYLYHRKDKSRQWKKKWFMVYNLVMYEFKRHEVRITRESLSLSLV